MGATKISWADEVWNPVWGCNANCSYCYAKNIAKRFAKIIAEKNLEYGTEIEALQTEKDLRDFKPTLLINAMNKNFSKSAKHIFVGSMSDIAFWKKEWIYKTIEKIKQYPQHHFMLLTKFPHIYRELDLLMPENVYFGITVTQQTELNKLDVFFDMKFGRIKYVSFEPLLSEITDAVYYPKGKKYHKFQKRNTYFEIIDWVIIGTMSGNNRKAAKIDWISKIVATAYEKIKPVFVKQIEINGKVEHDYTKFPRHLQLQEYPE